MSVIKSILGVALPLALVSQSASDAGFQVEDHAAEAFEQAGAFTEARAEILVLGTDHLSNWPRLERSALDPLNEALTGWAPDLVLIERPTAWQAELYADQDDRFSGIVQRTLGAEFDAAREAQAALGVTAFEAENILRAPDEEMIDPVRTVLLLMAAFDVTSAAMHWMQLTEAEQTAVSDSAPQAARVIAHTAASRNETMWIAADVAGRLGHARLHPFDDQIEKAAFSSAGIIETLVEDGRIEAVLSSDMIMTLHADLQRRPDDSGRVLDWYRHVNSPEFARIDSEAQWGSFLAEAGEEGRRRVALWETRNLRMAANIREVMALEGGSRILVVVGSAHRAWLETYLRRQSDVRIVRLAEILPDE